MSRNENSREGEGATAHMEWLKGPLFIVHCLRYLRFLLFKSALCPSLCVSA